MSITSAHGVLPSSATVTIRYGGVFLINVQFHNQSQIICWKFLFSQRSGNEILLVELEVFSLNLVLIWEPLHLEYSKQLSRLWTIPKRGACQSLLEKTGCFVQKPELLAFVFPISLGFLLLKLRSEDTRYATISLSLPLISED